MFSLKSWAPATACVLAVLGSNVGAQVVQLPAFRQTSYSGTVSVPDAGTASLGGVRYSASGSNSRGWGPYAGRAIGSRGGGVSLSASVQIIDLQAMDEAILAQPSVRSAATMGPPGGVPSAAERSYLSGSVSAYRGKETQTKNPNDYRLALAGGLPGTTEENESQVEADIRFYLEQGKEAEKANRIQAARVYYRMAVDRMTPEMVARYHRVVAEKKAADQERRERNRPDRIRF